MTHEHVKAITTALGADAICERVGVGPHSVRHARFTGKFPAAWFDQIDRMCREQGIECPREIFNWKSPSSVPTPSAEADG